jgi:hypothetical protein
MDARKKGDLLAGFVFCPLNGVWPWGALSLSDGG